MLRNNTYPPLRSVREGYLAGDSRRRVGWLSMLNERERSPNVERRAVFFVGDIAVSAWLAMAVFDPAVDSTTSGAAMG